MKQYGTCISGDSIQVNNLTKEWIEILLHPATFYRNYDTLRGRLENIKGYYAEIDLGEDILIRFSEDNDAAEFQKSLYV